MLQEVYMQEQQLNLPRTTCPVCGKITPKRDIRDKKPQYCSRICAGISKFKTRYQGSLSGPMDKPVDIMTKTKWQGTKSDGLISEIPTGA